MERGRLALHVRPRTDIESNFPRAKDRLAEVGYVPLLRSRAGRLVLYVSPQPPATTERVGWNLILLLATVGTTLFVGYTMSLTLTGIELMANPWHGAVLFSAGMIGVLGCHELGHKLMADRRGVEATFPYFIPVPFFIGTPGAVIKMKAPAPNRDALFDVGAAGPIAGFLSLIPITVLGLLMSYPVPIKMVPKGTIGLPLLILFGSLLDLVVTIPEGHILLFHPLAFVGWVGMLVTMLNLMPVGMLDGGHVSRVLFGEKLHWMISFAAVALTFILGFWPMAMLMLLFAVRPHPGPLEDVSPLTAGRKLLSLALGGILVVCLVPLPW